MKTYRIPHTNLDATRIAYGCMMIGGRWDDQPLSDEERKLAFAALDAAYEGGINFYDHADIYTIGKSELVFAEWLKLHPGLRDKLIIQSKCGIQFKDRPTPGVPGRYNFSYQHIVQSVEGILSRLAIDTLDILLLHRPDPLVEPEEVARAFDLLHEQGKVRYFGVSNHTPWQMELLKTAVRQPLVANQLELSLTHPFLIDHGVMANRADASSALASDTLDYCRVKQIMIQAWSPVGGGKLFDAKQQTTDALKQAAALVAQLAEAKQTTPEAIVLAWLLRHPAGIQPIIGSVKPERIAASCQADAVELSREEWYSLWTAARGRSMP